MQGGIDELIRRADGADRQAADALFSLLYNELHALAEQSLRHGLGGVTIGATTLLHEAYLSIAGRAGLDFPDRARFLAYAARAMRGLVIDHARRNRAQKRGRHLELTLGEQHAVPGDDSSDELVALGDALERLAAIDPSLAELVDMHFFCGFTFAEIGEFRGVSERTVQRDWRKARLLLHHALGEGSAQRDDGRDES
jgi:RNA polymerase sigma factor (TIGR02999 family)